jgi:hypothetical protein
MIEGVIKHWKELKAKTGFSLSDTQRKRVDELIGRSKSIETFITTELELWPAAALGMAILLMEQNDAVSDRLWGN